MTEEDLEEASEGGDSKDWFEEGGCPESSKVERWECKQLQKKWGESGHLC